MNERMNILHVPQQLRGSERFHQSLNFNKEEDLFSSVYK